MQRSTWTGAVTVVSYGTPTGWDLPEAAQQQLVLAHRLRNHLVELYRAHQQRVEGVWNQFPALAQAQRDVDAAKAAVDQAQDAIRDQRVADRSTRARTDTKAALTQSRTALREARAALRAEKERHYATARDAMRQEADLFRQQRKELYAVYVQQQGLYWATYNDVVAHFDTTLKNVTRQRQQGMPAQVNFHRFTGEGTLAVQPQRGAGQGPRSPQLLASGQGRLANVFQLSPWVDPRRWDNMKRSQQRAMTRVPDAQWDQMTPQQRKEVGHGSVQFSIGGGRLVHVPVIVHRMLPADADVTLVRVSRRLVAGRPHITVSVTARIPAPPARTRGPAAAVHVGWRSLQDEGVRVGVVASTVPLPPIPDQLQRVLHLLDPHHAEVRIDRGTLRVAGRPASIRSTRDRMVDDLRQLIIENADAQALPAGYDIASIKRWRSAGRFVHLLRTWPGPGAPAQLQQQLDAWLRQERHLWQFEANERQQIVAHIRDTYRNVAAWVGSWASLVVTDDWNVREVSKVPELGEEDTEQARIARATRQTVAPGSLRSLTVDAAQARGVATEVQSLDGRSLVHTKCGHGVLDMGQFAERIHVHCSHCGETFDQDANVVDHLLAAVTTDGER